VIAPQQFFLQNQIPWYSMSFFWEENDLSVTILVEKVERIEGCLLCGETQSNRYSQGKHKGMEGDKCNAFG